ncbi:hypothetical protein LCGC14_2333270 [marine sediment metagenome]|uniref:Uncharacterized protein n=1 Tax=marine sediment metagenome TaxID=412755 RepID=A0A0F9CE39_9ZZZZ
MDKLKKTIELIESHQNTLGIYVVDPCVNLTVKEMFDVLISEIERLRGAIIKTVQDAEVREEKLDKEIEQLRKEKEWLIHDNAQSEYWCSGRTTLEKCRERIIMRMQQALKESGR